jgi:hypothetical protein
MLLAITDRVLSTISIAEHDFTGRFHVSAHLYGRKMRFVFAMISQSLRELQAVIVCGFSGMENLLDP